MKRRRQPPKSKPRRPSTGRGRPSALNDNVPKMDDKHMGVPKMTIEERKAAQLAKWRKELGLDEES